MQSIVLWVLNIAIDVRSQINCYDLFTRAFPLSFYLYQTVELASWRYSYLMQGCLKTILYYFIITKGNDQFDLPDIHIRIRAGCYKNSCSFMQPVTVRKWIRDGYFSIFEMHQRTKICLLLETHDVYNLNELIMEQL